MDKLNQKGVNCKSNLRYKLLNNFRYKQNIEKIDNENI